MRWCSQIEYSGMSRTMIISSKSAPSTTVTMPVGSSPTPPAISRYMRATRAGVSLRPPRSGSSPMPSRMRRTPLLDLRVVEGAHRAHATRSLARRREPTAEVTGRGSRCLPAVVPTARGLAPDRGRRRLRLARVGRDHHEHDDGDHDERGGGRHDAPEHRDEPPVVERLARRERRLGHDPNAWSAGFADARGSARGDGAARPRRHVGGHGPRPGRAVRTRCARG